MNKKVISKILFVICITMFVLGSFSGVHANVKHEIAGGNEDHIETLLKVIIVLITIILIMGVCIIKFIYDRYRLVIRFEKREDTSKKEVSNGEENGGSEEQEDENVHVELNMTKLFAIMLIIVGVIIVASFM